MNFKTLIPAFLVAIGLVILGGFAWPLFSDLGQLQAARAARATLLQQKTDLVDKEIRLKADLKKNQTKLAQLDLLIPNLVHEEELLTNVVSMVEQSGVALKELNLTINDQLASGNINELNSEVSAVGGYSDFKKWLDLWEKNIRLIDLREFSLTPDQSGQGLLFSTKSTSYFAKTTNHEARP